MRSIKATDTRPELVLLRAIKEVFGRRRVVRYPPELRGHPDFYLPSLGLVLFCDGCLFHGCRQHCRIPRNNSTYWLRKIQGNAARDRRIGRALRQHGYSVWRVWEHDCQPRRSEKLNRLLGMIRKRLEQRAATI